MVSQTLNDVPPPPYTETDIYSHTANSVPGRPSPQASQHGDDATSTATGDIIYTPPLTPHTSTSFSVRDTHIPLPFAEPRPAVAAYFDSRPPPPPALEPPPILEETIAVDGRTVPDDLPYPTALAERGVTEQDWRTFVNFLLPEHTARSNEAVADRKLRAEAAEGGDGNLDAEAQLSALRSDDGSATTAGAGARREDVEMTVGEWNAWFFAPRGIVLRLEPAAGDNLRVPGSWDQAFDSNSVEGDAARAGPSGQPADTGHSWNIGGIRITNNGIFIGDSLVADRNGIRVGQFTADTSGVKYAGRNILPGGPPFGGPQHPRSFYSHAHGYGHQYRGPMAGGRAQTFGNFGQQQQAPYEASGVLPQRALSDTSSSSSDSDSDSDCGSDISLPDYDEVEGGQFAVYSEVLRRWLAQPHEPITKAEVRELKAQLRAAKRSTACGGGGQQHSKMTSAEKTELRKELKALIRAVKAQRKSQRQERKQARRLEKQKKKAEKRERKEQRKKMKKAEKDHRRGRAPPAPPAPSMPEMPGIPPTPLVPGLHISGMPPVDFQSADNMGRRGRGRHGGGRGRGCGEGGFGGGRGGSWGGGWGGGWGAGWGGNGDWVGGRGARGGLFGRGMPGMWPPGAWPDAQAGDSYGSDQHSTPRHQSLNENIRRLQERITAQTLELSRLDTEMAGARGFGARRNMSRKMGLEKEIEALQLSVETLQVQADEELARHVEAMENRA